MGFIGILLALGLLIGFAYRGWSVLLLCPLAALVAALFSGEPLLASWTQVFMPAAAGFLAQFLPLFLLGALFGKLMDDSGSVRAIADAMSARLGAQRAMLAVVLAGAIITYGGVSLFVAFFVLVPMAQRLFRQADIPRRLMPAAIALGTSTFTMTALPGTPAIQNAIPMPYFGTTLFAAPGLGLVASAIMLAFGMWWLGRARRQALRAGEGYAEAQAPDAGAIAADEGLLRERASASREFDPAELAHGRRSEALPPAWIAALPLAVVIAANLAMSLLVLPRIDGAFLAQARWGNATLQEVGGVWSVIVALVAGICALLALQHRRLGALRDSVGAGVNASALAILSVSRLVGVGAVVRVAGVPLTVIGVLERKGQSSWGQDQDDVVIIPILTANKRVLGPPKPAASSVNAITVRVRDDMDMKVAEQEIRDLLRQRHKLQGFQEDDFWIRNLSEMLQAEEASSRVLTMLLACIASVSLLVGGIGIMNIMLVSVTERTREIGLRMAVGARGHDIRTQFLVEAVTLSLTGGMIGIVMGLASSYAIAYFAEWRTLLNAQAIVLAFGFAPAVGIFFGLYPAQKAAQLNPIEALRYE